MSNTIFGKKAEIAICKWLRQVHKIPSQVVTQYKAPFDILANGYRVECKVSSYNKLPYGWGWSFNIHRHGILNESQTDFYVLKLCNVPGFIYAIHLVVPAPIGIPVVIISLRSLLTRWGKYFNLLAPLRETKVVSRDSP